MTEAQVKVVANAKVTIEIVIKDGGDYAHNVVSCALRSVARECGKDAANDLVAEYGLTEKFGIHTV